MQPTPKPSLKLPLFLMIGPAALLIVAIVLYAFLNFIMNIGASDTASNTDLFGDSSETSALRAIANITLYLFSAISILTFLPGMIAGIILLVKHAEERHALEQQQQQHQQRQ